VNSRSAGHRGTVERSTVIRLLAAGVPPSGIVDRLSKRSEPHQGFSPEDLKSVLSDAGVALKEKRLLPPAETAFTEGFGAVLALASLSQEKPRLSPAETASMHGDRRIRPTATDLDELRTLAQRLIHAYLARDPASPEYPRPKTRVRHNIALRYAEALLRQEEILDGLEQIDPQASPLQAALTGTDRGSIEGFLLYRNLMGRFETLDSLADQWERSVIWVENDPASYGHEDFSDRLISRDSLEDALGLLSPRSRRGLEHRIRLLDERFFAATQAVSVSTRPCSPWCSQRWWWFRVPRLLGESFQHRLRHVAPAAAQEALATRKDPSRRPGRAGPC
jgi:hypothetical protein